MRRPFVRCADIVCLAGFVLFLGCMQESKPTPVVESSAASAPQEAAAIEVSSPEAKPDAVPAASISSVEQLVELLDSAKYKLETDDRPGADDDYRQAGQLAATMLASGSELTRQQRRVGAIASYYFARAAARGPEPKQALAAIRQAFDLGFEDLERVNTDAELANVRELPEFGELRAKLQADLAARTQQEIADRLARFEPYPLEFRQPDLEGKEIALTDFPGQVVVLTFWGTWCVKCRAEIPLLNRLQDAYRDRGVQVVGLAYEEAETRDEAVQRVREFQQTQPLDYVCLIGDDTVRDQVRPPDDGPPEWVFPVTLVLDQAGRVRLHFDGEVSYVKLDAAVRSLLGDASP